MKTPVATQSTHRKTVRNSHVADSQGKRISLTHAREHSDILLSSCVIWPVFCRHVTTLWQRCSRRETECLFACSLFQEWSMSYEFERLCYYKHFLFQESRCIVSWKWELGLSCKTWWLALCIWPFHLRQLNVFLFLRELLCKTNNKAINSSMRKKKQIFLHIRSWHKTKKDPYCNHLHIKYQSAISNIIWPGRLSHGVERLSANQWMNRAVCKPESVHCIKQFGFKQPISYLPRSGTTNSPTQGIKSSTWGTKTPKPGPRPLYISLIWRSKTCLLIFRKNNRSNWLEAVYVQLLNREESYLSWLNL